MPSRSKEHDTTVFVCDYIVHADVFDKMDLVSVFGIQQASPVCPFPRPVSLPVLAPVHTVMASEPPLSLICVPVTQGAASESAAGSGRLRGWSGR